MNSAARYNFVLSLGTREDNWQVFTEHVLVAIWKETWIGIKDVKSGKNQWMMLNPEDNDRQLKWAHLCLAMNFSSGFVKQIEDGKLQFDAHLEALKDKAQYLSYNFDSLTLGCAFRDKEEKNMSIKGRVTDFQMWDFILNDADMTGYTSCNTTHLEGSLINWNEANWKLINTNGFSAKETASVEHEICLYMEKSLLLLPVPMRYFGDGQAMETCQKFSGRLASFLDADHFNKYNSFIYQFQGRIKQCYIKDEKIAIGTWWAATDNITEGVFIDRYTKRTLEYLPWANGRPIPFGAFYQCLVNQHYVSSSRAEDPPTVTDEMCHHSKCTLCEFEKEPKVRVRGLCLDSPLDRVYTLTIHMGGMPLYVGRETSTILFEKATKKWVWRDRLSNNTVGFISSPLNSFLLGVNTVNFLSNDEICLNEKSKNSVKVKFTTCSDEEFTCNNGMCIPLHKRCNQVINCQDHSDEDGCQMFRFNENYQKKIAPASVDDEGKYLSPVTVNTSIYIESAWEFLEDSETFTAKFSLVLDWHDSRIQFYNIKHDHYSNAVSNEEIDRLWIPGIIFRNTRFNDQVKVTDKVEVFILRQGNFTRSGSDVMEEAHTFRGIENKIRFESFYTKLFQCQYQLNMYPFDLQVCKIIIEVKKYERKSIRLIPNKMEMLGQTVSTKYIITSWELKYRNDSAPSDGLVVHFYLKRRLMNELLTTYLPSSIILLIVYITNYFKPAHFEALVAVNLTSMLVLTTLFISVSSSVLKASYIKVSGKGQVKKIFINDRS